MGVKKKKLCVAFFEGPGPIGGPGAHPYKNVRWVSSAYFHMNDDISDFV